MSDLSQVGGHANEESAVEALTLVVAHLAAQLTMTQIRLRGIATALAATGAVDEEAIRGHIAAIADREAGHYLAENLGERLTSLIDTDQLTRDIIAFVTEPE
ncbi:MAG: hypothetical protein AB7V46_15685 [Thermomicrobiales bacterium]